MAHPKALLFDVFGSVVDWRGSLIEELSAFFAARGLAVDTGTLVDRWRAAYAPSMDRVRRGELSWTRLDDLHRASLDGLVAEMGVSPLTEDDRAHLTRAWHRLRPWPDSVAGLTRLRQNFTIAPLSNGNVSLLLNMARNAGLPWQMIFGADIFRHYKPDAENYLGAARLLDLPPGEVMLCAAHNGDLAAARSHGLMTAFWARPTEYGPLQVRDFAADEAWDFVVADIEGLATALGC